jgi:serine protease inhibitor
MRIYLIGLFFILLLNVACKKEQDSPNLMPTPLDISAKGRTIIKSNNDFGIRLFSNVAKDESKNMMLSPLSASAALSMLLNGSNGETYTQIRDMLGYTDNMTIDEINAHYKSLVTQLLTVDPKVDLALANAVFHKKDYPFKVSFLERMNREFSATVEGLDFSTASAVDRINRWASDNTNKRIPKIIDNISPQTVMFLLNALYFKGDWTYKFDAKLTENREFTKGDGSRIMVPTMSGTLGARQVGQPGYQAIEIPYGKTNFSMLIVVPNEHLKGFYDQFTPEAWEMITSALDAETAWKETLVSLPKFKFEYDKQLNEPLMHLGMVDAFDDRADLTGISDNRLQVSAVKQNTFVEVNEEGTEAAAVTVVDIIEVSIRYFEANKPFIFAIRERTSNTLLFIGAVQDPSS